MADGSISLPSWLESATARRAAPGERDCADQVGVAVGDGVVLVGVFDGLGHGADAVHASLAAARTLASLDPSTSPARALEQCHLALTGTRGAVGSAVSIGETGALRWCGVGDVEAILHRARSGRRARRESLLLRSGVLGDQIQKVADSSHEMRPDDVLVLATDGIRRSFVEEPFAGVAAEELAMRILSRHLKGADDALAMVIRFLG